MYHVKMYASLLDVSCKFHVVSSAYTFLFYYKCLHISGTNYVYNYCFLDLDLKHLFHGRDLSLDNRINTSLVG